MEPNMKNKPDCKKKEHTNRPLEAPPKFVIGTRIRGSIKSELCDPQGLNLRVGMQVIVDAADGSKMGLVEYLYDSTNLKQLQQ